MSLSPQELGSKLRAAREARGLKQQDAADALDIPRTAITNMEAGVRAVTTLEIARLAILYQQTVAEILGEDIAECEEDPLVSLHRADPRLRTSPDVDKQVRFCLELCQEGTALEVMLGRARRSGPPAYPVAVPRTVGEAVVQGSQVATQERQRLGLGNAPVTELPDLISNQGVWAATANLPSEMSGLFLRHPSIGMAVLVNAEHVKARQRFSYAHEYAHCLLDRQRPAAVSTRNNAMELMETRANSFAATLLMPEHGVEDILRKLGKGQPSRNEQPVFDVASDGRIDAPLRPAAGSQVIVCQDVARIAHRFGVSYQAMVYRLRSLNVVSRNESDQLLEQESSGREYLDCFILLDDFDQLNASARSDRELHTHLIHLALEATRRNLIAESRLIKLGQKLGLPSKKLERLIKALQVSR